MLRDVERLHREGHSAPGLVVILVGSVPASQSYVQKKLQAAAGCGIDARVEALNDDITSAELLAVVHRLNADESVRAARLPGQPSLSLSAEPLTTVCLLGRYTA